VAEELASPLKEKLLSQKKEEKEKPSPMSPQERKVFELLNSDSLTHIDVLVEGTEFSVSEILSILLKLELKGSVFQRPGKYFQRRL
jgi:DNA processing protein